MMAAGNLPMGDTRRLARRLLPYGDSSKWLAASERNSFTGKGGSKRGIGHWHQMWRRWRVARFGGPYG
jgi:hypothetical protein